MDTDVAQLERNINKCYVSAFIYILVANPRGARGYFFYDCVII